MSQSSRAPGPDQSWLPAILAGVAGLIVGLLLGTPGTAPVADRGEVQAVLDEQLAAWNAGDLDRFVGTYQDSDELTFFSGGKVMRGRKEVHERYRKNYQAEGKEMGKLTFSDLDITPLSSEWAQARGRWKVVTSKETLEGLLTLVLRRFPDGWKIVHDHTSRDEPKKD